MISESRVDEIKRMLNEKKFSQRKISRLTGTSRATIAQIALGKRPDYAARHRERQIFAEEPTGPLARCPSCGGKVYMPCRLCRARAMKEREANLARRRKLEAREAARRAMLVALRDAQLAKLFAEERPRERRAG